MKTVLVVDNHPVILTFMSRLLERKGYEVMTASDGLSALELLKDFTPDAVFLDLVMPNIGGDKLCRIIRSMPEMKEVYIVILSAIAAENPVDFIAFGADACIAKGPFNIMGDHILSVLEQPEERAASAVRPKTVKGAESIFEREITKELLCSKNHLEVILKNMSEGIFEVNEQARIIYANPSAVSMMGIPEERLLSSCFSEHFVESGRDRICGRIQEVIRSMKSVAGDREVLFNGRKIRLHLFPVLNGKLSVIAKVHDVTDQELAEKKYRKLYEKSKKAEAVYRSLLHSSADAIVTCDLDGNTTYVSPAFTRIFGWSMEEVQGSRIPFLPESEGPSAAAILKDLKDNATPCNGIATRRLTRDGRLLDISMSASRYDDHNGRPAGLLFILRDVSEQKKLEAQLRQALKMEAIGTLAGGIAHDFNNILGAIIGYSEMAALELTNGEPVRCHLKQILKSSHRARDLVKQILAFSRANDKGKKAVQVASVVREVLKMLRASLPTTIDIRQDIRCPSGIILADHTQIHQVIMNLCTNAAHAMEDKGGVLTVALDDMEIGAEEAARFSGIPSGHYVKLMVKDNGHGMIPAILERIFDPYFTTKEPGKGTGMGLAMVHGIVKSHGGSIAVESRPERGTIFEVVFPRMEGGRVDAEEHTQALPTGKERILFVDDEELLVDVAQQMLERLGYRVFAHINPVVALQSFLADPQGFDLVITDMTMPSLTGDRLTRQILEVRPDIPVLISTGYSEAVTEKNVRQMGAQGFLMKPIMLHDLARIIRKTLDDVNGTG
jgi:PAS domain S-box-containing protein